MQNHGWVLVWLFLGSCCTASSPAPVAGGTSASVPDTGDPVPPVKAAPGKGDGTTVVEGPLEVSKKMPFVQRWALPHDELSERFGDEWMTRLAKRRLRVRGVTEVYVCPPASQCLVDGEIPRFSRVAELGLVCRDGRTLVVPKPCPSPRCLRDCDIHVMTRHDACGRNGGPNWPSWCADSNDEMRSNCEATCHSGCAAGQPRPVWCD